MSGYLLVSAAFCRANLVVRAPRLGSTKIVVYYLGIAW